MKDKRKYQCRSTNTVTRNSLQVYYTNSRSLRNKMDEFRTLISTEKIDIAIFSETWMNTESREFLAEYQVSCYNIYESNRQGRKGGGVAIYVKDSLNCYRKSDIKINENTESVWVEVNNGRKKIVLGAIYRSPKLSRDDR